MGRHCCKHSQVFQNVVCHQAPNRYLAAILHRCISKWLNRCLALYIGKPRRYPLEFQGAPNLRWDRLLLRRSIRQTLGMQWVQSAVYTQTLLERLDHY